MRLAVAGLALAAGLVGLDARACGVCIEDKVAVAYDHAVVSRAFGRRHVVVFAEVRAPGDAGEAVQGVRAAAASIRGVDRASVRGASAPAALSFALDPAVRSPESALRAVERAARPAGITLKLLRVMGPEKYSLPAGR